MNLQQLRYVVATAECGSMTAAARAVHVAQPALSRAVRTFEAEVGIQVFAARGRSVQLTPLGAQLVDAARRVLHEVDRLHTVAAELRHVSTLTLTSTPTLEHVYTSPLVARYVADHPGVSIEMQRANGRDEVLALVRAGASDLGVADFDEIPSDLVVRQLDHDEVVLIAPPGTELPDVLTLQHLDGMALVLPGHTSSRRAELDALFGRHAIRPRVAIESDERATWVSSMFRGLGSFLGYRSHAEALAVQGAVVRPFRPTLARTIGVVHRDHEISQVARAFVTLACATATVPRAS